VEANTKSLIPAATTLILTGKLLAPAGDRLREDIDSWNLYSAINVTDTPPVNAQEWLSNRLRQLGVQSSEDLALIEAQDLMFDGIPDWERDRFDQAYPRMLNLANLHMTIHYNPKKKLVTLEKIGGVRKNKPQRKELPLWSGWSIRYRDGSKVLDIL
jgi:ATP-dependent helicase HrpB